jgi:hypothetical protein
MYIHRPIKYQTHKVRNIFRSARFLYSVPGLMLIKKLNPEKEKATKLPTDFISGKDRK